MKAAAESTDATLSERAMRDQLERIVSSASFYPSDRLKLFITFVSSEALQGRGDALKEYTVGVHVFGREATFDPRTDPVVRVQARRLRARLEKYYREEGQNDEIVVDLPKGGYVPVFRRREGAAPPAAAPSGHPLQRNTLAVRPFVDLTPSRNLEPFCNALTGEVIRRLIQIRGLQVHALGPASESPPAMLLEGSVRSAAEGFRVAVDLVDAARGCYAWSDSVQMESIESFAVQDEIATALVTRLQPHLLTAQPRGRVQSENLAARNLCKQGMYHLEQRTDESLERAADIFERAVVEDAQYSLAHSGLSDAYALLASYGLRLPTSLATLAMSSAATAVMLDDESGQARTSLAHAKARANWNWLEAELEFQRAIKLDPSYPTAHHWYARCCLMPLGRLDEALEEITLAQRLDPVSSIIAREVASIYYYRRDFDAALAHCDQAIELNPHFPHAYFILSLVQKQLGDSDEALTALVRAVQLAPKSPRLIAALGWAQASAGRHDDAFNSLAELEALAAARYVSPWERAILFLGMKDVDRCLDQLALAYQDRFFDLTLLGVDPRFDLLRGDRRFDELLAKTGVR